MNQRVVYRPNPEQNGARQICGGPAGILSATQTEDLISPDEPVIQVILCPKNFEGDYYRSINQNPPDGNDQPVPVRQYKFVASNLVHELFHTLAPGACKY